MDDVDDDNSKRGRLAFGGLLNSTTFEAVGLPWRRPIILPLPLLLLVVVTLRQLLLPMVLLFQEVNSIHFCDESIVAVDMAAAPTGFNCSR